METDFSLARAEGILPSKVGRVVIRANRFSYKHSLLAALQAPQRAKFVPGFETKIGASDLIFAIRSLSDPSKPKANTQQEEALGKPE